MASRYTPRQPFYEVDLDHYDETDMAVLSGSYTAQDLADVVNLNAFTAFVTGERAIRPAGTV